jgi:hypothetical protein
MGQRARILTQIVGIQGWKVTEHRWEGVDGNAIEPVAGYDVPADASGAHDGARWAALREVPRDRRRMPRQARRAAGPTFRVAGIR